MSATLQNIPVNSDDSLLQSEAYEDQQSSSEQHYNRGPGQPSRHGATRRRAAEGRSS